jgi:mycothiol system anti-sigma-R factor
MDCQDARVSIFRDCDHELEPELVASLVEHLGRCPHCARHHAYVHKLLAIVRVRCCRDAAPSQLKVRILASFPHRGGVLQEARD